MIFLFFLAIMHFPSMAFYSKASMPFTSATGASRGNSWSALTAGRCFQGGYGELGWHSPQACSLGGHTLIDLPGHPVC